MFLWRKPDPKIQMLDQNSKKTDPTEPIPPLVTKSHKHATKEFKC